MRVGAVALVMSVWMAGCGASPSTAAPPSLAGSSLSPPEEVLGVTTREAIEQADPTFAAARGAEPLPDAVAALGRVEPGAQVVVVLGMWCSDSRRELSRFFRALDALPSSPPFEIVYIAVDRAKESPGDEIDGLDIDRVPTFIVRRGGAEIGRVIETAPTAIERDLASLLSSPHPS